MANTVVGICAWVDLPGVEKSVLMALADAANDDGVTWIPVQSRKAHKLDLIKKTGWSERTIQGAIGRLVEAGHLSRAERPGKGVIYQIHPNGQSAKGWAEYAASSLSTPPHKPRGAPGAGAHKAAKTPAAGAGKPSVTITPKVGRGRATVDDILALGVTSEQWDDFAEMRKRKRAPLTPGAVNLAWGTLRKLAEDGHPPGAVVEQSTLHAYTGFFPLKDDTRNGRHRPDHDAGAGIRNNLVAAAVDSLDLGDDRPPAGPRD